MCVNVCVSKSVCAGVCGAALQLLLLLHQAATLQWPDHHSQLLPRSHSHLGHALRRDRAPLAPQVCQLQRQPAACQGARE